MRAKDGCAQRYGSHSLRLPRALNVDAPLVKVADASGKHKLGSCHARRIRMFLGRYTHRLASSISEGLSSCNPVVVP